MKRKVFTQKPMLYRSFRLKHADAELWRIAAARAEISQSEFLRAAIREKARRVLLDAETLQAVNA
jgi:uncharacterized protein (DUF1778 family)